MSNYHFPLYDRSCSVFQRRFKQVYFQLNPFLERTSLKDEDAEIYQPNKFWEYLYSDSWSDDCSLRVLEGELLELLMMLLCIMEKEEEVNSYLTFAYAKNKRRVHKCYTDVTDKKEEFTTETRASFGAFYKYLVEENKFDPRFKKANQRKKKMAEKIKLKKDSKLSDKGLKTNKSMFDTHKLNKKYSIEKIRAIKLKKEKKPPVLNILRKFCRVNRMMNSLAPKAVPRKSIVDANKAKQSAKAFGMFRRLNKKATAEVKPAVEVGKLKTFNFLKLKDHVSKIPDVDLPNFESTSIEDCKKNLLRALGDFVIRKEKITSSYTYETLTTITFTRPSTYIRMHQIPKNS
ncbi:uncharacterized protein LOC126809482 [Patella vulgata]|uniref:uncharacterized protein LOC126809482 n=1 Tax=Patella vulgata TaxID=6465 RepID=UPI00217F8737|nr:uncharacterized protein LOC126809482 [Patella vulgata]